MELGALPEPIESASRTPAAPGGSDTRDRAVATPRVADAIRSPQRTVPEVLIPRRDVEATGRFLNGRHRWLMVQGTPPAREVETLETPAVVDWELKTLRVEGTTARVLDAWPLVPSD
jgi:hypothetical protein